MPAEIQAQIVNLFKAGHTVADVTLWLKELQQETSRSAVGRFRKSWADMLESQLLAQQFAEVAVRELADEPESKIARLNTNLIQSALFRVLAELGKQEEQDIEKTIKMISDLARAHKDIARAAKDDVDTVIKSNDYAVEVAESEVDSLDAKNNINVIFANNKAQKEAKKKP